MKYLTLPLLLLAITLTFTGCGGGNNPINEGKDQPIPAKTEKEKQPS